MLPAASDHRTQASDACDHAYVTTASDRRTQASSAQSTAAQLADSVRDGVVDIAFTLPGYTAGRFPIMEVPELPFKTRSATAGLHLLDAASGGVNRASGRGCARCRLC